MDSPMMLLRQEPCDLILEVMWMMACSPMTFDFQNLQLIFDKEQEQVLLQGDHDSASVTLHKGAAAERN